jgi:hypothetical protein
VPQRFDVRERVEPRELLVHRLAWLDTREAVEQAALRQQRQDGFEALRALRMPLDGMLGVVRVGGEADGHTYLAVILSAAKNLST